MRTKLVPLRECPIGLFIKDDTLCVKTEYGNESYIVSSGEFFWGGAKDKEQIDNVLVLPIDDSMVELIESCYGRLYKGMKMLKRSDENAE